jgi:hypothetical protein
MIKENSGKIYRFKLEHNFGYGFAEVYDFTDHSMFDGRIVYAYNRCDKEQKSNYEFSEIRKAGIALGPIRLYKFPNVRGLGAWKFLLKTNDLLINEIPTTKNLRGMLEKDNNWDNLSDWYDSDFDIRTEMPKFVPYKKVRYLETRILNGPSGIEKKLTMKVILDSKMKVSDYYDLNNLGDKNMFVQMINTYYPLTKTKEFLKQLPKRKD